MRSGRLIIIGRGGIHDVGDMGKKKCVKECC